MIAALIDFWLLFRRACISAYKDNCFGIAKGAAYSALLSFFPVLTTVTAILVQSNAPAVSRTLSRLVFQAVPPGTENVVMQIFTRRGHQPAYLLLFASVLAVWAASGVMLSLMEGFRAAYRIPKGRPFLKQRGIAALLVIAAAVPVIIASAVLVFGQRLEAWMLRVTGVLPLEYEVTGWFSWGMHIIRTSFSIGCIILGISFLYCVGPNPVRRLRRVIPGALLTTSLWWLSTLVFAWYVRNIANYNVLYGSVGAVIALLVWMYVLSIVTLLGCEYNAERDRLRNPEESAPQGAGISL